MPSYMHRPSSAFMDAAGLQKREARGRARTYGAYATQAKTQNHNLQVHQNRIEKSVQ